MPNLSDFDLKQMNKAFLCRQPEPVLRHLIIRLFEDLFLARDRLNLNPSNCSRPASGMPQWQYGTGQAVAESLSSTLGDGVWHLPLTCALDPADFRDRVSASVHDDRVESLAQAHGVQEFIEMCPATPFSEALAEVQLVNAPLVMRARIFIAQIPAKIYEYLRAGKPFLGLTGPDGDTAGVLRGAGLTDIARLDSTDEIAGALTALVSNLDHSRVTLPQPLAVYQASRRGRSQELETLLAQAMR